MTDPRALTGPRIGSTARAKSRSASALLRCTCASLALLVWPLRVLTAQSLIVGTVYDSLRTQAPLASATVVLVDTSRYATTDRLKRFRFDSLAPGRYTLGLIVRLLDTLGVQLPVRPVDITTRQATVQLAVPSARSLHTALCPGSRDPETGVVFGRITDVDNAIPIVGATVGTSWAEFTVGTGGSRRAEQRGVVQSQANGVYVHCSVPLDVTLNIVASVDGRGAGPVTVELDELLLHHLDLAISRGDSAARVAAAEAATVALNTARGTATLSGRLVDARRSPLASGIVRIAGTDRTSRADSTGAFRLPNIPAGTRQVEVRAVGAAPSDVALTFETSRDRGPRCFRKCSGSSTSRCCDASRRGRRRTSSTSASSEP